MKFAKLVLILLSLLLTSTACSVRQTFPTLVPTPTITPVPTAPPTDEFCPPPQNWISYITQPGDSIASL
ncbi:MAG TPA: hypothetical protein VHD90_08670, partial [Phototrophicaceae bacterium]|nr:hypothetical protein [Phototrophicaceae bacterium]